MKLSNEKINFIKIIQKINERFTEEEELAFGGFI